MELPLEKLWVLQTHFECNSYPSDDDIQLIALILELSESTIAEWFENYRLSQNIYVDTKVEAKATPIEKQQLISETNVYQIDRSVKKEHEISKKWTAEAKIKIENEYTTDKPIKDIVIKMSVKKEEGLVEEIIVKTEKQIVRNLSLETEYDDITKTSIKTEDFEGQTILEMENDEPLVDVVPKSVCIKSEETKSSIIEELQQLTTKQSIVSKATPQRSHIRPKGASPQKEIFMKSDFNDIRCTKCKMHFQDEDELERHICESDDEWQPTSDDNNWQSGDFEQEDKFKKSRRTTDIGGSSMRSNCNEGKLQEPFKFQSSNYEENTFLRLFNDYKVNSLINKLPPFSIKSGKLQEKKELEMRSEYGYMYNKLLPKYRSYYSLERSKATQEEIEQSVQAQTVEEKDVLICNKCGRSFEEKTVALQHVIDQHFRCGFKCKACGYVSLKRERFQGHVRKVHLNKFTCPVCDKVSKNKTNLKLHMLVHESNRQRIPCELCDKTFVSKSSFDCHVRYVHTQKEKKFVCSVCSKTFYKGYLLKMHSESHKAVRDHVCPICKCSYKSSRYLSEHKSIVHSSSTFECVECGKVLQNKIAFNKHKAAHINKFMCEFCGKCLATKQGLKEHLRTHTGEKPYQCEICGTFISKYANYLSHVAYHKGERKFSCDICGAKFSRKNYLRSHVEKVHQKQTKKQKPG